MEKRRDARRGAGLKIQALATGLQHPRSLYVLPNGDVLVVESKAPGIEPITRPKDFVMQLGRVHGDLGRRQRRRATASRCCATAMATA